MKRVDTWINNIKKWTKITATLVVVIFVVALIASIIRWRINKNNQIDISGLKYNGEIAVEINDNQPTFSKDEIRKAQKSYESYSKLDSLSRCGTAEASISKETMPAADEKRTSLGSVNPSGWQDIKFWVRCHLIGWQLTAENANEENLITGTNRMNMSGMLPYENMIAKYIEDNPDNHVLYRVTPIFEGNNLVASGVNMQAESIEDKGRGIKFNIFVFNYQPGSIIDYKTGMAKDDPEHQTVITITDKETKYTGAPVEINEAEVTGSTGTIKYIYYIDEAAKKRTTEATGAETTGSAPIYRGEYYVRAVVSGDEWYPMAASNIAKLIIK